MPLIVYPQYILPPINCPDGILEIRINTDGLIQYTRTVAGTVLYIDPPNRITDLASLKKKFSDKDGDISTDTFGFHVVDSWAYGGREDDPNTGIHVSEDLTSSNDSLFDKIFSYGDALINPVQPILIATLIKASGREPFFIGTINTTQIPREHIGVAFDNTANEVHQRILEINATDIMSLLSKKTIQDLFDAYRFTSPLNTGTQHTERWNLGVRWDNNAGNWGDNIVNATLYDGGVGSITDEYTGARGITIEKVLQSLNELYAAAFPASLPIDSSFDFYSQETTVGNVYPLTKFTSGIETLQLQFNTLFGKGIFNNKRNEIFRYSLTNSVALIDGAMPNIGDRVSFESSGGTLPTPLSSGVLYYVVALDPSATVFDVSATPGGAKIPITADGTGTNQKYFIGEDDFPYVNSLDRSSKCLTLLSKFFWQFGCIFYNQINSSGIPLLTSKALRTKFGDIPSSWILLSSGEDPTIISSTCLTVVNENDELQLQAGVNDTLNNPIQITIPFRMHQWGSQVKNYNFIANLYPESCLWFDSKLGKFNQQQVNYAYAPPTPPTNYADGWMIGKFLWKRVTDDQVYSNASGNSPGNPAMINMAAMTIKGSPSPGENDGYYNSLVAPAIFWYQELVGNKIVLNRKYKGILANDGTVQSVRPGLETILPIRKLSNGGNPRTFRATETEQEFLRSNTTVKLVERFSDYSTLPIPPLKYITGTSSNSVPSSTSQSQGGGTPSSSLDDLRYVSTIPLTALRNIIRCGADAANGAIIRQHSGTQSASLLEAQDAAGTTIFSGINNNGSLFANLQNGIILKNNAGTPSEIQFNNPANTFHVGFKASSTAITSNIVWTLPSADGLSNYIIKTSGAGVLSFDSIAGLIDVANGLSIAESGAHHAIIGIGANAVALDRLVQIADQTILGNNSGGTGNVLALTALQARTVILPSQASNSGKFLTTNGTDASWATVTAGMTNPMTTTGDIIYSSDNSGTPARLAIGATDRVLSVASGLPSWVTRASVLSDAVILDPAAAHRNQIVTQGVTDAAGLEIICGSGSIINLFEIYDSSSNRQIKVTYLGYMTLELLLTAKGGILATASSAANVAVIAQGFASQTASILEIQDSSNAVLSKYDASGNLFLGDLANVPATIGALNVTQINNSTPAVVLKEATPAGFTIFRIVGHGDATKFEIDANGLVCGGATPAARLHAIHSAGSLVMRLEDTVAIRDTFMQEITTAVIAPQVMATVLLAAGESVEIIIEGIGRQTAGIGGAVGDTIGFHIRSTWKELAGVITNIGTQSDINKSNANAAVTLIANGGNTGVDIKVTTPLNCTYHWRAAIHYIKAS